MTLKNALRTLENALRTLENALRTLENALRTLENALRTLENGHKLKDAEGTLDPWNARGTQGGRRSIERGRDKNVIFTVIKLG
jgi:chromosome segregation ATPase